MFSALSLILCAAASPTTITTAATIAPHHVYVGMYLTDVSDFDLKAGRFKADLHVWMKWLGDEVPPNVTFENGEIESKEVLSTEHEAEWYSLHWRVQGTFRGEFPVHAFPFDRQTLPIIFGLNNADGRLVPDLGASGMSPSFSVSGWSYEPQFAASSEERVYGSDLGSIAREGKNARQGLATFSVEMRRPFGPYLIKFALPLALILLVALLALLLPPERLDVRSAMGITALLSCIAFHYTQADTLPNVTYLVAADKLFLGAYVFVAATLLLSIIAFRLSEAKHETAQRGDRLGLFLLPILSAVGVLSLVTGALWQPGPEEPVVPNNPFPTQPLLRVAVTSMDNPGGGELPARRGALVVRAADGTFRPMLAKEAPAMTNSLVRLLPDGGMRIRWALRADARWSDGTRITSDDLIFSLNAVTDAQRVNIARIDDRTIDVTYSERRTEWLAGFAVFPKSAALYAADGGRAALSQANNDGLIATSGAFMLGEFEKGTKHTLRRNEQFAAMKPAFERVEAKLLTPEEAVKALLSNEVDVVPTLTADGYELLKGDARVKVLEQPGELLWVLVPNLSGPPWSSLEARQALLTTLDRLAMVKALEPMPTRVGWGWRAEPELTAPRAARLELSRVTLNVEPIHAESETHALLARLIEANLKAAGVEVEIVQRDQLDQAVQRGDFEGLALLGRETNSPGPFMNVAAPEGTPDMSKAVGPHYDDEMAERYEAFDASLYAERRASLEAHMQRAWFTRLPMLPLVLTSRLAAVRADLEGPEWGQAESLWWNVSEWHRKGTPSNR
ncbi:MAG: ABC transporter substrate-binding protein [Archangium sp.]|nr:ABC transporter substrate-binding protein [Archangium sp.]